MQQLLTVSGSPSLSTFILFNVHVIVYFGLHNLLIIFVSDYGGLLYLLLKTQTYKVNFLSEMGSNIIFISQRMNFMASVQQYHRWKIKKRSGDFKYAVIKSNKVKHTVTSNKCIIWTNTFIAVFLFICFEFKD